MLNQSSGWIRSGIVVLTVLASALAKQHSVSFNVPTFRRQESWVFVDRSVLDSGQMALRGSVRLVSGTYKSNADYAVELVGIRDDIWTESLSSKCESAGQSDEERRARREKEIVFMTTLNAQNGYAATVSSTVSIPQTETYHWVLRECGKRIANDGYGREARLEVWIDVRNNEQHISSGEELYAWLLPLLLASATTALVLLQREKEEEGDNWIKLSLKASLGLGVASIAAKYAGFLVYAYGSGVQHGVFDVFYLLLHALSDSVLLVLLMLLAFGWTVTFRSTRDFDLYVPLACMLGLVNVIMTMLNKIADGQHDKYHMYDTIPAYIMIGFRLVALLVFGFGAARSWLSLANSREQQPKLRRYLLQLTALGALYLGFVPLGFWLVRLLASRFQKQAMFFGVELVRFGSSYWLALLAGWKKSAYRSIIDQSFMEKGDKFY